MNKIDLKDTIKILLRDWEVTIDEAYMVNVTADAISRQKCFAYVEEFSNAVVDFSRYGKRVRNNYEIYLCTFTDFENTAEEREQIRMEKLLPAAEKIELYLNSVGVNVINRDVFPRGFDANEVLIHLSFSVEDLTC